MFFTHNRPGIDLNGEWNFVPDPMQRCRGQQWWKNPPRKHSCYPCWDHQGFWKIQVPGTWNKQFSSLEWYAGHVVYMKEFSARDLPRDHEAFLVFDGVVYAAEAYLNGQLVGRHDWGYSPFAIRVTDTLQEQNQLFVLIDNELRGDRVPGIRFDWFNDGGIINPVRLVFVPRIHLENFRVQTRLEANQAVVGIDVWLNSRDVQACEPVTARIPELGLQETVEVAVNRPGRVEFRIESGKVDLWCPSRPTLYRIEISTQFETIADDIGFREVRTEGHHILLNGSPIRLYGVAVHSEFPDTGRTATPENIVRMIDAAKEVGANFIRCAHYPYTGEFSRALDRAGLMMAEEVPAYWLANMGEPAQTALACGMMEETIRRDWNRASIILWSVSNECCWRNPLEPRENNYPYWFAVVPMVRSLDPTRLITSAEASNKVAVNQAWSPEEGDGFAEVGPVGVAKWRLMHTDEWHALMDVFGGNNYVDHVGEAKPAYQLYVELLRPYGKPMILTEFGVPSVRGEELPDDDLMSEVRAERMLRDAYQAFAEIPELTGYCLWSLNELRTPLHWRWYSGPDGALGRSGMLDENWQKKRAFGVLKECIAMLKDRFGEAG